ncbi:MFS transporter [Campylobacter sp. VicNov18]|uniref:MFS transporter n=1 Tax=Campylobacter bilis TaxID=2691918 RepID=UPI00130E60A7|nr:MFS transporter [Campylobacter bilis]MPV63855.1 MFS transporter [Campylobacter hepaticus]MBM0637356.1 MFS transporter [Campylobacter bilis]MCC8278075.1 MFS transporter [Campylobacter bilis]MCC8299579.1 MFS transporter [Campylobacter bilis]MCC8300984.1 MFS transporter [Campylobacter bilis]
MQEKYKNIIYASLGGILEFYDFVLFAFFLDIFARVFFPPNDIFWTQINVYIAFGAAYLARPFGAVLMGHFADRYGRKNIFYISMLLMVLPSFALAFLPSYENIGIFATLILFFIRILQGLAVGSEVSGAWIYVSEFVKGRQIPLVLGFISATLTIGLLLGNLAALGVRTYFNPQEVQSYAWRIPFIIGGFFGILALFLRNKLSETPEFIKMQNEKKILAFPLLQALKTHKTKMFICFLMTLVLTSGVATLMILPKYFEDLLVINKNSALWIQNFAILAVIFGSLFQGILASKWGSYKICSFFSMVFIVFSVLFSFYDENFLFYFLFACFAQGIITFAPVFMTQIFKSEFRFSGLSFAYNISYAILGFLTPFIVNAFYKEYLGVYFFIVGFCSLLCVFLLKRIFARSKVEKSCIIF